ncbi:hypothetical protein ABZ816_04455 [Actinosynnema sp. NPDC047251]|uniref:Excreted virulence factor EspC, type VII ESX diderm n=1 Tax=Saccharothrix espanaensis (strain ATCC 51144 / DSM 44229 / JCM 9112 / NBRC 15066 / NRRL 15764) TaxID=1179773 RepID=K0JZJ4_SACES|nr:hypothetical protein [Saccharothrix espanaensis]CCH31516.1 hypothetical protein BN6_42290 [Saccharothrix espanaensis DSM 44229]
MTPPSKEQVKAATDGLRAEAGVWDDQSARMGAIVPMVDALRLDRVEAGLFQVVFDTYHQVMDQVVERSREATRAMTDIGTTLRAVADTYDDEETAGVHRMRGIY